MEAGTRQRGEKRGRCASRGAVVGAAVPPRDGVLRGQATVKARSWTQRATWWRETVERGGEREREESRLGDEGAHDEGLTAAETRG